MPLRLPWRARAKQGNLPDYVTVTRFATCYRHGASILLALVACLVPPPHGGRAALAAPQIGETRSDLQDVQKRIRELQKDIEDTEESRSEAADALASTGKAITASGRKLRQMVADRASVEAELLSLEKRSVELRERIDGRHERLARWLRQHYREGADGRLARLLAESDPSQVARNGEYLRHLGKANLALIEVQRRDLGDQEKLAESIRARRDRLAALAQNEKQQQAELTRARAEHASKLATLDSRLRAQRTEVSTLKQDERRMERLIEGLERMAREQLARRRAELERKRREARIAEAEAAARAAQSGVKQREERSVTGRSRPVTAEPVVGRTDQVSGPAPAGIPFDRLKGRLKAPLSGELIGRFGEQRANGGTTWKGVFIRAGAGSQVRAVAAGEVVFADWLRGFGNLIIIDHGDGYLSIYGNNEQLLRSTGQGVTGGDAIASVGTGGSSDESGLYFEIRHRGQPVDPLKWVRLR
ncbi:murein hydrolase activator EnvC family protein [Cognatazoarcus halotolerans]|uniref:murein hydrolase activator EnvC family protein n=1 Tax=Cognatazoarcus halotolerans TaxID=2686016 RepID=UPI00135A789B|nr:peptidoglycan DD-metalloendopeptidase family protein [Cognatazoarcus halotolerans]